MKTAFKMKLKPGYKDEYKKRHDALWPEMKELLKENGISDYYIFLDEETNILFAVHEQGIQGSAQEQGQNEVVKKWWAYMADIMETNEDNSPKSTPLEQVFYLE